MGAKPTPDLARVVDAASDHVVAATINGRPMKLQVVLDTHDRIILNAGSAVP